MKKLLLLFLITFSLLSCNDKDNLIKPIIKNEIKHVKNYNKLYNMTNEESKKFIDSLYISYETNANTIETFLKTKKSKIIVLDSSIYYLKKFKKELKNK